MKIVMNEAAIESLMNHCLIEAGTEYAESIGTEFHKVFLDPIKPQAEKSPYIFDVKLTLNGIDIDPTSFFKLVEEDIERQAKIEARKMLSNIMYGVEKKFIEQLNLETEDDY